MTSGRARPPRLAESLARRVLGRSPWSDVSLGDLEEEFHAVATTRGRRRAQVWYAREVFRLVVERVARSIRGGLADIRGAFAPGGDSVIRTLLYELKHAARSLLRQPRITAVVIVTLGLGLGANAAVFTMVDSLLLRPFTVRNVDRLVVLSENSQADPFPRESVAPANYREWKAQNTVFDRMASFDWWDVNLSGGNRPARVQGHRVTAEFFDVLGVSAARGRLLEPRDEILGAHRQVVISDALWHSHFAAAADVVGRTIRLDGETFEVVGVAEPGFDFPFASAIWAPLALSPTEAVDRTARYVTTIARLAPGQSFETASAAMHTIYDRQRAATPDAFRARDLVVRTFSDGMVDVGMPAILILWQVAAVLVLLIGCTNVASLLLAQGAARERELAVRVALGAGRARLVRQLLAEGLVLSLAAVPLALALATAGLAAIRAAMPAELVRFVAGWDRMSVDWRLALVTAAAALVAALLFGAIPALRSSRPRVSDSLREGTRSATTGVARSRLRRALVIAEVAIALPLLVASGLAASGAQRFASGPQGYDPDGVVRLRMILPQATYPDAATRQQFVTRVLDRLAADPRVERAASATVLPSGSWNQQRELAIEGTPPDPDRPAAVNFRAVSPAYLDLLKIPMLEGRGLEDADRAGAEPVAVISQSMARRYWPQGDAIGRRIALGRPAGALRRIVGITGDTIDDWFIYRQAPTVYVPVDQAPSSLVNLVMRGRDADTSRLAGAAREAVAAVDPNQPMFDVMTMRDAVRVRTTGLRFVGGLMAVFGAVALVLAAIGLYSVMSSYVLQRRREFGIRMALGAAAPDVLRQTIRQGGTLALAGTVIGLVLAVALARLMESALFGIIAVEFWLFAATAGTLLVIALAASYIPARQASRVDPIAALRAE